MDADKWWNGVLGVDEQEVLLYKSWAMYGQQKFVSLLLASVVVVITFIIQHAGSGRIVFGWN